MKKIRKILSLMIMFLVIVSMINSTGVYAETTNASDNGKTVLLMHMDGENNSSSFKDETGKTVIAGGNTKISTTQSKFGGSSAYFDGSGGLTINTSPDFGFDGDFTWECWMYLPQLSNYGCICGNSTTGGFAFLIKDSNKFFTGLSLDSSAPTATPAVASISANQWFHLAVTRSGSTERFFVNGKQIGSGVRSVGYKEGKITIGAEGNGAYPQNNFKGYIDELRIVKGAALYTGDFTPPTEPYQNSSTHNKLKVVLEPKEVLQLSVDDDLSENTKLAWTSSDTSVATVDSNGAVTAIKKGDTVITAKSADGSYSESINVLVVDDADDYRLAVDLKMGNFSRLTIDNYTNTVPVTWTSMDPTVATISAKGKVTAVGKGLALMTAKDSDGKVIGQVYVRVRE